ncbi:chemotaxis protein CheW [uncultured Sphingomonas sp.]|jgi:purine-binding chemotaxis protein CheW|uniref:chemotaxis protein CheW n=1 Tax=uncultured Sphingomonas sp. TaxID=158754 RepID=UPI00261D5489|nr:chemotaxis protein CheW [uncultured Sphingomonas sp.]
MDSLKLIARIADQEVAIATSLIESVVEVEAITRVPLAAPHIAGLAALRSRVLTIIDTYAALEIGHSPREGILQAVVVTIDHHLYGLLVDEVVDVAAIASEPDLLHAGLSRGWAHAALGLVEHNGKALLELDPARIVAGPAVLAA